jgi:hypothetical protein
MSADATAQIRIDIVATGAEAGANRVNAALDRIGKKGSSTGAANDNLKSTFDRLGGSMNGASGHGGALSSVLDNIRGRAAGAAPEVANLTGTLARMGPQAAIIAGVALAIGAVASKAIDAAAKVEIWKANLFTVTGSAQKAEESYAALVNFAAKTPFDLGQAVEGFTKLRTLGLQATEGALTSFGNTAAAMGKPLNQMIEAVADAATGEFERLKEFGIKSKQEGDKVKFTFGGVTTSVGKDAASIQKYLENLGNTKFGGAMARQMDTIKGAMSNVEDAVFQAFSAIGSGQLGASFKEILKSIASGVSAATPLFAAMGSVIGSIVGAVGSVLNSLGNLWLSLHGGATAGTSILDGLTVTFNLVAQGVTVFGNVVAAVFGAFAGIVNGVVGLFSDGFTTLLNWMGVSFETGGRSWTNSIMGIMRGVKFVVSQMPALFSIAINDVMRMFRNLGTVVSKILNAGSLTDIGAALSSIPGVISGSFANTERAMNAVGRSATRIRNDVAGADAAIARLSGRSRTVARLDTGSIIKPTTDPKKGDKDSGKSDAEKKAEKEAEFWKTLKGEVETAKLLPIEAENYKKQLELAKIVGDAEAETQKGKLADLMQQARTAKFVTAALDDHNKKSMDYAGQEEMLKLRLNGATEEQLAVEKKVADFRNSAQRAGVDLHSAAYKASEAQLRADEARVGLLDAQNKKLDDQAAKMKAMASEGFTYGQNALKTSGSIGDRQGAAKAEYDKTLAGLTAALDSKDAATKLSPAAFQAGVKKAGQEFRTTMAEIGSEFSQKMGQIAGLLGTIGNIIGGKLGSFVNGVGDVSKSIGNFENTKEDISGQFTKVFGENSAAAKSIGKAVGGAMAGMQIGEQIAGLGKALGVKTSKLGGQVGGAIGGAVGGPLGAAIGGTIGSVVGGLFKKEKKASAGFTMDAKGNLVGMDATGRGKEEKAVATALAGNVAGQLNDIASQLGAKITGLSGVSVGYRPGHKAGAYRVDPTGRGAVKGGSVAAFDTEAEAIAYAIKDAIKDGVLGGLDDLAQKAVAALDIDGAISLVKNWKAAMADFASMTDPVGAAIKSVTEGIDALRTSMVAVGASTTDLTKLDQYRAAKLDEVFKEQVSGFQSLLADLNGDAGGVTALNQLASNMGKLDTFKQDLAAGKTVNQDEFTALAQSIISGAGDVYATNSSQYQDIVSQLKGLTSGAITNATTAFNVASGRDPAAQAITDAGNVAAAQQSIANDYLRQIASSLAGSGIKNNATNDNTGYGNMNGRSTVAF